MTNIYSGKPELVDPYADVPPPSEEPDQATPSRLSTIRLSDVQPERVSWLWPGRIPAGKLVTLDGDPSLGKSTLSLAFAAVITTGGTWPDSSPCNYPGDVILLSAEDGLADTVRPRLDAAGADVTRVHAVQGVTLPDGALRPPTLADVDELHRLVTETGARLLVVDVLMAYLPSGTDSHKDQDIRRVLSRLSSLADASGCTVLLLRHLNKAKGGDPMYRGGGSIGIVGAVRAGMLVAKDPDDEEIRVLACTKSNLGPEPEALTYRLTDANAHGVARVEWIGTSSHDARALLQDRSESPDRPERDEAEAWLEDYLIENGKARSAEVKTAASKVRISERTLKRAAAELGVIYTPEGFPRVTIWRLPDSQAAPVLSGPRLSNRGPTGDRGPTGADLHKQEAEIRPDSQSGQLGHGTETRPDWEPPPSTARPLELVKLCRHCQEPATGNTAVHWQCALGSRAENGRRSVNTIICTICRTRLSLDDDTHAHPLCRGAAPLTDAEMTRLVAALGDLLGARPLTPHQGPR